MDIRHTGTIPLQLMIEDIATNSGKKNPSAKREYDSLC